MNYDIEKLVYNMENIFSRVLLEEKKLSLALTKNEFKYSGKLINEFIKNISRYGNGTITRRFLDELRIIENDFTRLYEDFDDKLLLFIVGDGNAGKSTLVNSLIGQEVAKTNFLPNTWKIDVYFPSKGNYASIIYNDGNIITKTIDEVKEIVANEEMKTKQGKRKYDEEKNKALSVLYEQNEIEEMKLKLARDYLYKSKIVEVRWPVKSNWILEQCHIVDTPGLNQDIIDTQQLGSILDYYHKADGVIWLINGLTVSGKNSLDELEKLNSVLDKVGGVRENIIGAVTRSDLIKLNSGDEGLKNVMKDANKYFGSVFQNIVPISGKKAFDGITKNNDDEIKNSNIYELQDKIKRLFIEKAEEIKSKSKEQGAKALMDKIEDLLYKYSEDCDSITEVYNKKHTFFKTDKINFENKVHKQISTMFKSYLQDVSLRVDKYIDELSEGQGKEFIKNTIYDINSLSERINSLTIIIENDMKRKFDLWIKDAYVSEYKYINSIISVNTSNINVHKKLKLDGINNIQVFTPAQEDDFFSLLGNMWGKFKFWLNKNKIKNKLNDTISIQCENIENELKSQYKIIIQNNFENSITNLSKSFKELILPFEKLDLIKSELDNFEELIFEESNQISLIDILREK